MALIEQGLTGPAQAGSVISGSLNRAQCIDYAHGISAIDTHYLREKFDASHLIESAGRAAFVDVGTNYAVPLLLDALQQKGLTPDAVDWVLLTHIHLDHAGGAGELIHVLPNARVAVHPRGMNHLAEPSKLIEATRQVYGEAYYTQVYGQIRPVPLERLLATDDETTLILGDRRLQILHTPGHALHHQAIRDIVTGGIFTGDTFGVSYRELDVDGRAFIIPTTTPTQFDPVQLHASVDRILGYDPPQIYLTHYGKIEDVVRLGADMHAAIDVHVSIADRHRAAPDRELRIQGDLWDWLHGRLDAHGVRPDRAFREQIVSGDVRLNTQGLVSWLDRRR